MYLVNSIYNTIHIGLHFDGLDNFHFLLSGHKVWKIYHPRDVVYADLIVPPRGVLSHGYVTQQDWNHPSSVLSLFDIQTRFSQFGTVHNNKSKSA